MVEMCRTKCFQIAVFFSYKLLSKKRRGGMCKKNEGIISCLNWPLILILRKRGKDGRSD